MHRSFPRSTKIIRQDEQWQVVFKYLLHLSPWDFRIKSLNEVWFCNLNQRSKKGFCCTSKSEILGKKIGDFFFSVLWEKNISKEILFRGKVIYSLSVVCSKLLLAICRHRYDMATMAVMVSLLPQSAQFLVTVHLFTLLYRVWNCVTKKF